MSRGVGRGRGRVGEGKGEKYMIEVSMKGKPVVRYHSYARDLRYALSRYEPDYIDAEIRYWGIDEFNKRTGPVNIFVRSSAKTLKNVGMDSKESFMKISELSSGMKAINVKAKVLEVSEPRKVMSRFGQINRLAIATIGDEDEKINLALWNQQIDSIVVNDVIQVKNGYITEFYGVKQLNVGKRGELKVIK